MDIWQDWTAPDGSCIAHIGNDGLIYVITEEGVDAARDPYFAQADMDALTAGEIDVAEYQRRHTHRFAEALRRMWDGAPPRRG